jgi:POT family proton-dependent oligopeptide transporter
MQTSSNSDPQSDRMPPGIPYIVGNEAAERFSYYGMRAILYIYLVALYLRFLHEDMIPKAEAATARADATQVTHLFFAGVYAFPLLGAVIADRLLGKYRVIFWVSLLYCAGHAALALAGWQARIGSYQSAELWLYAGLALIAVGAGGIKPCVSANVGDQFTDKNRHLVERVYQVFYFSINYGSFFSTLLTPLLYDYVGAEVAFGVPGVLMGVATFVFWLGRNRFVHVPPQPGGALGLLDVAVTTLLFSPLFAIIIGYFVLWDHWTPPSGVEGWSSVGGFFAAYAWLPIGTVLAVVLGMLLFALRQRRQPDTTSFLPVLLWSLRNRHTRQPGQSFFDPARARFGAEAGDGPPAVLRIAIVFSMVSVFWALFDQHASTWVEQAKHMDLELRVPFWLGRWALAATLALSLYAGVWLFMWIGNGPPPRRATVAVLAIITLAGLVAGAADLFGREMQTITMNPAQISALNPLMVMMIIPALNLLVYAPLRRRGFEVRPLQKMTVGMFIAAAAFAAAALLQAAIERAGSGQMHAVWQAIPYLLMTTAEVLVSITGLEFAYTQAPRAMKSTIMSFWLLCVTFGNLLVAFLAPLQTSLALSQFFWLFAGLMAAAAILFAIIAYNYKGKTYLQA